MPLVVTIGNVAEVFAPSGELYSRVTDVAGRDGGRGPPLIIGGGESDASVLPQKGRKVS